MKYYSIGVSSEIEVIGNYPQVEKTNDYNFTSPDSFWNVNWNSFPDFQPKYEVRIHSWAKVTNLLHTLPGFCGLCVDEELKGLLSKFNLPPHRFYPVSAYYKSSKLHYWWFHFIKSFLDFIDFQRTIFECVQGSGERYRLVEEFAITNVSELHQYEKDLSFDEEVRVKRLVLKSNFPNYDIIRLSNVSPLILISEPLKNEIEKMKISGFQYSEYKKLVLTNPNF